MSYCSCLVHAGISPCFLREKKISPLGSLETSSSHSLVTAKVPYSNTPVPNVKLFNLLSEPSNSRMGSVVFSFQVRSLGVVRSVRHRLPAASLSPFEIGVKLTRTRIRGHVLKWGRFYKPQPETLHGSVHYVFRATWKKGEIRQQRRIACTALWDHRAFSGFERQKSISQIGI